MKAIRGTIKCGDVIHVLCKQENELCADQITELEAKL
jgi:hypothetical protein